MTLPVGGWLSTKLGAAAASFPLPEPYVFVYKDTKVHGRPSLVTARSHGRATVELRTAPQAFEIEVNILDAYDVVLIDRIE